LSSSSKNNTIRCSNPPLLHLNGPVFPSKAAVAAAVFPYETSLFFIECDLTSKQLEAATLPAAAAAARSHCRRRRQIPLLWVLDWATLQNRYLLLRNNSLKSLKSKTPPLPSSPVGSSARQNPVLLLPPPCLFDPLKNRSRPHQTEKYASFCLYHIDIIFALDGAAIFTHSCL
jgi:hypothetical protein